MVIVSNNIEGLAMAKAPDRIKGLAVVGLGDCEKGDSCGCSPWPGRNVRLDGVKSDRINSRFRQVGREGEQARAGDDVGEIAKLEGAALGALEEFSEECSCPSWFVP
jgi:hypothetical protein